MTLDQLKDEYILFAKGEVDDIQGDMLKIDIKDTNRPDLWSAEGIAREIQGRITKRTGAPKYKVGKSKVVVNVDKKNEKVRPYTVCAVAKGLRITENVLSQMIQLQEKVCTTFGRNRKEVALGVYDLGRIKPPIRFTTVKPDGIKFTPLDFDKELTPREILQEHPKGKEFGHLLAGWTEYPLFIDSAGNVLSIPPIINSNYTGKVTKKSRDLFIECSGFDFRFLMPALNIVVAALADRGARIQTVEVRYPKKAYKNKKVVHTPDMAPNKFTASASFINKVSGLGLSAKQMRELLEKARYDVKIKEGGKNIEVTYPAYRQDIMHPRDVAEDVIVSYGYNMIEPVPPRLATIGSIDKRETLSNAVAEVAVGLGLQETLSYTLTNKDNMFKRMNLGEHPVAEIENPVSANWNVFRTWLMPGILEFLAANQHVEYPQKVFEIGDTVLPDEKEETKTRDVRKIACAIADAKISYEKASSLLGALMDAFGVEYGMEASTHPSFIQGRAASVVVGGRKIGVIGELSPDVLSNWHMEMPVAAFEIEIGCLAAQ